MPEIHICLGSSCFSRGNSVNLRILRDYLDKHGLANGVRTVGHLCEGMCSQGPNLILDGATCHHVDAAGMSALLDERFKTPEKP